jgi:hypothetical protein
MWNPVIGLKIMESMGIKPQTSPRACKAFAKSALPTHHALLLVIYVVLNIFELELLFKFHRAPWSLKPSLIEVMLK